MTSARECQALSSLGSLRPDLQAAVLAPNVCQPPTNQPTNQSLLPCSFCFIAAFLHSFLLFPQSYIYEDVLHLSTPSSPLTRPPTVPVKLWDVLEGRLNRSQLQAVVALCAPLLAQPPCPPLPPTTHAPIPTKCGTDCSRSSPITLLQGPPGTGKVSSDRISCNIV